MKIAFVGKGGSGKSTISWLFGNYLAENGRQVLSIDADFNQDLLKHYAPLSLPKPLRDSDDDFYNALGIEKTVLLSTFALTANKILFSLFPHDPFTQKYSVSLTARHSLMTLGDHTTETTYSGRCSHSFAKALKFYTPYLHLGPNQFVIIDSVAGTDMVNYGLYLGVDAIICVVEDTPQSVGVLQTIRAIEKEHGIPVFYVHNQSDAATIEHLPKDESPLATFPLDKALKKAEYSKISEETKKACAQLLNTLGEIVTKQDSLLKMQMWQKKRAATVL